MFILFIFIEKEIESDTSVVAKKKTEALHTQIACKYVLIIIFEDILVCSSNKYIFIADPWCDERKLKLSKYFSFLWNYVMYAM